jgi:uncharacterized protein YdaU (DUF1376 family)
MKIHTVQLHLGDLMGGTQHMSAPEFGAYVSLFLACYSAKDNFLPNRPDRLARMARCTPKEWYRVSETVMEKFVLIDDKIYHKRVLDDVEKYEKKSKVNKSNIMKRYNTDLRTVYQSNYERTTTQDPRLKTQDSGVREEGFSGGSIISFPGDTMDYNVEYYLDDNARQRAKAAAPGWDLFPIIEKYNNSIRTGERSRPLNPSAAFPAWVKLYTKGKAL